MISSFILYLQINNKNNIEKFKMSKIIETHILKEYQIVKELGSGSYGFVWEVKSKVNQKTYALKKIFDAFRDTVDAKRTYREIQVLTNMQHNNIIKLQRILKSNGKNDIYLLFQHMQSDLLQKSKQQTMSKTQHKHIFYKILLGLQYLHSLNLIHRDLKPANILISPNLDIKICDFGLIRSTSPNDLQKPKTQQIATKWYRAPQVLLGSNVYGRQIDMWSFGCIVGETLARRPVFNALSTEQIFLQMVDFNGQLTQEDISSLKIHNLAKLLEGNLIQKKDLNRMFGSNNSQFMQLITSCLNINPNKRTTVQQAIKLPLFDEIRSLYTNQNQVKQTVFQFALDDNVQFETQIYRRRINQLVQIMSTQNFKSTKLSEQKKQQDKVDLIKKDNQIIKSQSLYGLKGSTIRKLNNNNLIINASQRLKSQHNPTKNINNQRLSNYILSQVQQRANSLLKREQKQNILCFSPQKTPYFMPQKIQKKPINLQSLKKLHKTSKLPCQPLQIFHNKYRLKGTQTMIQQRRQQKEKEKELLVKYSMDITKNIYQATRNVFAKKTRLR